MTDKVSVVARKPFEYGGKTRTPKSGPFAVERAAAEQFQAMGLLRIVGDVDVAEPITGEEPSVTPIDDVKSAKSKPRRQAKARPDWAGGPDEA